MPKLNRISIVLAGEGKLVHRGVIERVRGMDFGRVKKEEDKGNEEGER